MMYRLKLLFTPLFLLLFAGLVLRIVLANFGTLNLDFNTFLAWSNTLATDGFKNFYLGWSDYLPGYLYVLWVLGKINSLRIIDQEILFKFPAILADTATGYLIYRIVEQVRNRKWAIIFSVLYLFNPAILVNSAMWGQVDSLTAFFALWAVYLAGKSSYYLLLGSAIALAAGTLCKPQAAYALPVILFMMIRDKWDYQKVISYLGVGLLIFAVGFIPFNNTSNLVAFIIERIGLTVNQYPYTSVNAFNFWGLGGFWKKDNTLGLTFLIPLVAVAVSSLKTKKEKFSEYLLLGISLATGFMFLARMHERHLLPALAPMLIAGAINPLVLVSYVGLSATYLFNLSYSYYWISNKFISIYSDSLIKLLIVANLIFTANLFYSLFKKVRIPNLDFVARFIKNKNKVDIPKFPKFKTFNINSRRAKYILAGILTFAFIGRVLFLGSPPNEYFDEVYHAFTARVMLHRDPKAWEWWNTPPQGFAYEWTHPPLAKEAMVAGMVLFGENSFGWRIPGALFGTGTVLLVYLIAKKLFNDEPLALLAAGVLSLDGLTLVLSRIGMNDPYFLFFALLAIYFFLKEKDLFSAVALGLAASSKWTVFWVIPILGVIFISLRKKIKPSLIWFLILPAVIYLISYIPFFTSGHTFKQFLNIRALFGNCSLGGDCAFGVQQQMWWYHTHLKATHAYQSLWWSWPLMIKPVWLYTSGAVNGFIASIYAIGNPLVFWFGVGSVVASAYWAYKTKDKRLGIVVFSYLAFFVPWALSPRIMFLYHYLPSIPFLAIATGYVLRKYPKLIMVYFCLGLILFVYFYPHWMGIKVPIWLDNSYYWLDSWR